MNGWFHNWFISLLEGIIIVGTALTAIGFGLRRVYNTARGVEKILEFTVSEKDAREKLAAELAAHIKRGEEQNASRSLQISEIMETVREISRETRPNGGSSMKDVLNHTAEKVSDISTRVAVLEEWKRTHT